MEHPQSLAKDGKLRPVVLFARNRLCALAGPKAGVTTANLLDRMLDATVVLGTSTPKADPSGDYAWQLFEKAETLRPGSFAALSAKAKKLTGGPIRRLRRPTAASTVSSSPRARPMSSSPTAPTR